MKRFLLLLLMLITSKYLSGQNDQKHEYIFDLIYNCGPNAQFTLQNNHSGESFEINDPYTFYDIVFFNSFFNRLIITGYDCDVLPNPTVKNFDFNLSYTSGYHGILFGCPHESMNGWIYWSPVINNFTASTYGTTINTTNTSGITGIGKKINIQNNITLSLNCDYTGQDFRWVLITSSGEVNTGKTGRSITLSGREIYKLIGAERAFQIVPQSPYYNFDPNENPPNKTYRNSYYRTETLRITCNDIRISDYDGCNGRIQLKYYLLSPTPGYVQVGQYNDITGLEEFFSLYKIDWMDSDTNTITLNYSQLQISEINPRKVFLFRVSFGNDPTIPLTKTTSKIMLFPPASPFAVNVKKYCEGYSGGREITISRDIATYYQAFQFYNSDNSHSLGYPYVYFGPGTSSKTITIDNLPNSPFYVRAVRLDSLGGVIHDCDISKEITYSNYPNPLLYNPIATYQTCSGFNNGKIQATSNTSGCTYYLSKPGMPVKYITSSGTSAIFTGLYSGTYSVYVVDKNGCSSQPKSVPLDSIRPLSFDIDTAPPKCYGGKDGLININNSRGGPSGISYQFSKDNINWSSNSLLSGFGSGIHTVWMRSVSDINCKISKTTILSEPPPVVFDPANPYVISDSNGYGVACENGSNGSITLKGGGGTGNITYYLQYIDGNESYSNSTGQFTDRPAGLYRAFLTDENNCSSSDTLEIELTQPPPVTITPAITPEKCPSTNDGSIIVTLHSPRPIQSYLWKSESGSVIVTKDLIGYPPGNYSLDVTDNAGCETKFESMQIPAATPVSTSTTSTMPSCIGYNNGTVKITGIAGGTPDYTYVFNQSLQGEASSFPVAFENLPSGSYTLEIRDTNYQSSGVYANCKTTETITIAEKEKAIVTAAATEPLCFGENTGKIEVLSVNGPDEPYVHAWLNNQGDSVGNGIQLPGIPAGEYSAQIRDSKNCLVVQTGFEVTGPPLLKYDNILIDSASCREIPDAMITIGASGGTGNIRYSDDAGQTFSPVNVFGNIPYGPYNLRIADELDCIADTAVEIFAGSVLLQLTDKQNPTCFGNTNGLIQLAASGSKTAGYNYHLQSQLLSQNKNIGLFNNLPAQQYSLFASDAAGCYSDTLTEQVTQPDSLVVQLSLIDSAACMKPLGKLGYNITGGNGYFKFQWSKAGQGAITDFNPLALTTGTYSLNVTDTLGCQANNTMFVPDRPAPVISGFDILEQTWCNMPLGKIKVNAVSGSPPYRYQWNSNNNDTLMVVSNLFHGTYQVSVTDRYQCSAGDQIAIEDGPEIDLTATVQKSHCGLKDGSAELTVEGGVSPYLFRWPDSVSQQPVTLPVMEGLYAGDYEVFVIDSIGCEKPFIVAIGDINGPSVQKVDVTKAWCGLPTGTLQVFAADGAPPYHYQWIGPNVNRISDDGFAGSLPSGLYSIRVTDSDNCSDVMHTQITDSSALQPLLSLTTLDSSACGKPLGSLGVEMANGLPPYNFRWNTGDITPIITGLLKGTYKVVATDERGCRDSLSFELPEKQRPRLILVASEDAYCGFPSGKAFFAALLGKPPYSVYLAENPDVNTPLNYSDTAGAYIGIINSLIPSLYPYRFVINDSDGCSGNEVAALIQDANPLAIYLTDIQPVSCYNGNDGRAEVTVTSGIEPYSYKWSVADINSNINNMLPAGTFALTITDALGCTKTLDATSTPVTQPLPLNVYSVFKTDPSCYDFCDGYMMAFAEGGNGGYIYIWNSTDSMQTVSGLCAGNHFLRVADSKGCNYSISYNLKNPPEITETNLPGEVTICSGQIYKAKPGDEFSDIIWNSNTGFFSDEQVAELHEPGIYYLSAVSQKGCPVKDTLRLLVSDNLLNAEFLMMSEAFTGDTIVIIEVSWPPAEQYSWKIPEDAKVITSIESFKELVFDTPGNYYIELHAALAGCSSVQGKYIEIFEPFDRPVIPQKSAGDEQLITLFELFPNPARETINLNVKLAKEANVRVEIISLTGNKLAFVANEYGLDAYQFPVNVSALMQGMYLVRLIASHEVQTKIIIIK